MVWKPREGDRMPYIAPLFKCHTENSINTAEERNCSRSSKGATYKQEHSDNSFRNNGQEAPHPTGIMMHTQDPGWAAGQAAQQPTLHHGIGIFSLIQSSQSPWEAGKWGSERSSNLPLATQLGNLKPMSRFKPCPKLPPQTKHTPYCPQSKAPLCGTLPFALCCLHATQHVSFSYYEFPPPNSSLQAKSDRIHLSIKQSYAFPIRHVCRCFVSSLA